MRATNITVWLQKRGKSAALVVSGLAIGVSGSAMVMAAIPDADNNIHACYTPNAGGSNVRIIDSASQTCNEGETPIRWAQGGPTSVLVNTPGADLSRANFVGWDLTGFDFTNTNLQGSIFRGAKLTGVNFAGASLENADISNQNFTGFDFRGATFGYTDVNSSNFTNANLSDIVVDGDQPFGADTAFNGANFTGAKVWSSLENSNFTGANFTNAWFGPVNPSRPAITLSGVNFTNANFEGVQFATNEEYTITINASTLLGADLSDADVSRVVWNDVVCPDGTNSDQHDNTCVGHLIP
jgi:uncharacterized protein YjbI with pentapeptide repeats